MSDLTALIVESEYIIALDIMMVLESQGFRGSIARSAKEVQSLPSEFRNPSLAILELEIDKTDEQALAVTLKAAGTPVIGITAEARISRLLPAFADVAILIKPVPETQLIAALQSVLPPSG